MAIQMLPESNGSFQQIPQRLTNPSCIGTVGEAKPSGYNVYNDRSPFLGTTAQHPLPFENDESLSDIAQWCPWGLQQSTSNGPNGGVYTYPDGSPNRPAFDPCYSACARYNQPSDCCTGQYNSPSACSPSQYSRNAKAVCPDAYSYGSLPRSRKLMKRADMSHSLRRSNLDLYHPVWSRIRGNLLPWCTLDGHHRDIERRTQPTGADRAHFVHSEEAQATETVSGAILYHFSAP